MGVLERPCLQSNWIKKPTQSSNRINREWVQVFVSYLFGNFLLNRFESMSCLPMMNIHHRFRIWADYLVISASSPFQLPQNTDLKHWFLHWHVNEIDQPRQIYLFNLYHQELTLLANNSNKINQTYKFGKLCSIPLDWSNRKKWVEIMWQSMKRIKNEKMNRLTSSYCTLFLNKFILW